MSPFKYHLELSSLYFKNVYINPATSCVGVLQGRNELCVDELVLTCLSERKELKGLV